MSGLFNGQPANDGVHSRGLQFGDGVFRTLLIWNNTILDWDAHQQKLREDCAALKLQAPDADVLRSEAAQLIGTHETAVLKIVVVRQTSGRGYAPTTSAVDRVLLLQSAPTFPETHWTHGIQAFKCALQLSAQPALAGIKHLNRLEQVMASAEWPAGMDEGLLCDQQGQVICGTRTNLFWVKAGHLYTPELTRCGVAGMMRSRILAAAKESGLNVQIVSARWQEMMDADEVFVNNALIGIWPVHSIDRKVFQAAGPVTQSLQNGLGHPRLTSCIR